MDISHIIKLRVIVLLICPLLLQSCWAEDDSDLNAHCFSDCTTIEGTFTTEDGTIGIKNVQLEFSWSASNPPGLVGVRRKIATSKTDENGYYRISFYADERELTSGRYAMEFHLPEDSYLDPYHNYFKLFGIDQRDTLVKQNYHIPKKGATLQVSITNPEAIPEGDKLNCIVSYKVGDLDKNTRRAHYLSSLNTSQATIPTAARQYTYLRITRKENDKASFYLDSMILDIGETRLYEISY